MSGNNTETADSAENVERPLPAGYVDIVPFPESTEGVEHPEAAKHAAEAGIPRLDAWYALDGRLGKPVGINEAGIVAVEYADAEHHNHPEFEPAWRFEEDNENVRRVPEGVVERPEQVITDYISQHLSDDLGTLGGEHPVNGYGDAETVRDVELALTLTSVVKDRTGD